MYQYEVIPSLNARNSSLLLFLKSTLDFSCSLCLLLKPLSMILFNNFNLSFSEEIRQNRVRNYGWGVGAPPTPPTPPTILFQKYLHLLKFP